MTRPARKTADVADLNRDRPVEGLRDAVAGAAPLDGKGAKLSAKDEGEQREPPTWPVLPERALTVGYSGPRLPTFPTLDGATRGGLPQRKLIISGGAPGACKTTVSVQWGVEWAKAGALVAIYAGDEDLEGLLIRIGQQHGIDRDAMERGDPEARRQLAECLRALPNLDAVDADEDEVSLEDLAAKLRDRRKGDQAIVLIVDSIQALAGTAGDDGEGVERRQIKAQIQRLKRIAKSGFLVVAISELNRGGYRSRNAGERVADLAAFHGSNAIEYGGALALVFRAVDGDATLFDVAVAKNRIGGDMPTFRLALDRRRAGVVEVQQATKDDAEADAERLAAARDAVYRKILRVVEKSIMPIRSQTALEGMVKGARATFVRTIFKEMLRDGVVCKGDDGFYIPKEAGDETENPQSVRPVPPRPGPSGTEATGTGEGESPQPRPVRPTPVGRDGLRDGRALPPVPGASRDA